MDYVKIAKNVFPNMPLDASDDDSALRFKNEGRTTLALHFERYAEGINLELFYDTCWHKIGQITLEELITFDCFAADALDILGGVQYIRTQTPKNEAIARQHFSTVHFCSIFSSAFFLKSKGQKYGFWFDRQETTPTLNVWYNGTWHVVSVLTVEQIVMLRCALHDSISKIQEGKKRRLNYS